MTRVVVHIGLPHCGTERIQDVLDAKRGALAKAGVLLPSAAGRKNHTRLFMAVTDADHIDPLRWHRGQAPADQQARLLDEIGQKLAQEVAAQKPDLVIITAHQLAMLSRRSELERLRALVAGFSDDIAVVAHVDEQARLLVRHYGEQIAEGRLTDLSAELMAADAEDWRQAALGHGKGAAPELNAFAEIQSPPFWLDYAGLVGEWSAVFGPEQVSLRPYDAGLFQSAAIGGEVQAAFGLPVRLGQAGEAAPSQPPSAVWLTQARLLNELFQVALQSGRMIPRRMWRRMLAELEPGGPPLEPGSLTPISEAFATANQQLVKRFPDLVPALKRDRKLAPWSEADPAAEFRATQYFAAFLPQIDAATLDERKAKGDALKAIDGPAPANGKAAQLPSPEARAIMPPLALANFTKLAGGRFAPHNRLGRAGEDGPAAPYAEIAARKLPKGSSGNVIVGCMKNEGPYVVEWVAYHRAIGFDNFLIYTNGCTDGTDLILDRLQHLGVVQHRNNDDWKGKSPQQHALNRSLKEDVIRNAEWIAHIDVDEFINIRTGNGTLPELLAEMPDATNIAMTWRLFGYNGVAEFDDLQVIEQFDSCAPKYCPKPHTAWGFKTLFRNIGAYDKMSCHRPNKLHEDKAGYVSWYNGSGRLMDDSYKARGWRSDMRTIGYDLVQLNHYALRSAESFLIKRQRGRALHVDRTIGLNYWIRMDWSDHTDLTIQRNLPRLKGEMARLLEDKTLRGLHEAAVSWHRAKAAELHADPEFRALYDQALKTRLSPLERVAYALALDMES